MVYFLILGLRALAQLCEAKLEGDKLGDELPVLFKNLIFQKNILS
jgi:hypothetical protein